MTSLLMLVWVSRQASLHSSLQYRIGVLHLGVEKWLRAGESASDVPSCECYATLPWHRASESSRQVSLPVTCQPERFTQPDRLTWSCDHASHVLRHHVGVITVERSNPKGLSTFSNAPSSCRTGDSNSSPPDLELGALIKWLAADAGLSVSAGFSTYCWFWKCVYT